MKANYHTHTYRCHHASLCADEDYVISAIKGGYNELAFTDHIPFKSFDVQPDHQSRMTYEEMSEYLNSINKLKDKYHDKISIYSGFEVEFFPNHLDYYQELRKKVDIFILGQHCPICLDKDYYYQCRDEDLDYLVDLVDQALHSGLFNIYAHPDYFMFSRKSWDKKCEEITHKIAKILEETQIPAEINLGGIHKRKREIDNEMVVPYPYRKFWEIISQYDVKVILGCDAHNPVVLENDDNKKQALEILKGLDLKIIDHIEL